MRFSHRFALLGLAAILQVNIAAAQFGGFSLPGFGGSGGGSKTPNFGGSGGFKAPNLGNSSGFKAPNFGGSSGFKAPNFGSGGLNSNFGNSGIKAPNFGSSGIKAPNFGGSGIKAPTSGLGGSLKTPSLGGSGSKSPSLGGLGGLGGSKTPSLSGLGGSGNKTPSLSGLGGSGSKTPSLGGLGGSKGPTNSIGGLKNPLGGLDKKGPTNGIAGNIISDKSKNPTGGLKNPLGGSDKKGPTNGIAGSIIPDKSKSSTNILGNKDPKGGLSGIKDPSKVVSTQQKKSDDLLKKINDKPTVATNSTGNKPKIPGETFRPKETFKPKDTKGTVPGIVKDDKNKSKPLGTVDKSTIAGKRLPGLIAPVRIPPPRPLPRPPQPPIVIVNNFPPQVSPAVQIMESLLNNLPAIIAPLADGGGGGDFGGGDFGGGGFGGVDFGGGGGGFVPQGQPVFEPEMLAQPQPQFQPEPQYQPEPQPVVNYVQPTPQPLPPPAPINSVVTKKRLAFNKQSNPVRFNLVSTQAETDARQELAARVSAALLNTQIISLINSMAPGAERDRLLAEWRQVVQNGGKTEDVQAFINKNGAGPGGNNSITPVFQSYLGILQDFGKFADNLKNGAFTTADAREQALAALQTALTALGQDNDPDLVNLLLENLTNMQNFSIMGQVAAAAAEMENPYPTLIEGALQMDMPLCFVSEMTGYPVMGVEPIAEQTVPAPTTAAAPPVLTMLANLPANNNPVAYRLDNFEFEMAAGDEQLLDRQYVITFDNGLGAQRQYTLSDGYYEWRVNPQEGWDVYKTKVAVAIDNSRYDGTFEYLVNGELVRLAPGEVAEHSSDALIEVAFHSGREGLEHRKLLKPGHYLVGLDPSYAALDLFEAQNVAGFEANQPEYLSSTDIGGSRATQRERVQTLLAQLKPPGKDDKTAGALATLAGAQKSTGKKSVSVLGKSKPAPNANDLLKMIKPKSAAAPVPQPPAPVLPAAAAEVEPAILSEAVLK